MTFLRTSGLAGGALRHQVVRGRDTRSNTSPTASPTSPRCSDSTSYTELTNRARPLGALGSVALRVRGEETGVYYPGRHLNRRLE